MKALYKYPQTEFPYARLIEENRRRGLGATEFELIDTGAFHEDRYFDVFAEYAKAKDERHPHSSDGCKSRPGKATLHLLPTLWFRNTWSWGEISEECTRKPSLSLERKGLVRARHEVLGEYELTYEGEATPLFTENETNAVRLFGSANGTAFTKDAFHERVIHGREEATNLANFGTKFAPYYVLEMEAGESRVVRIRLSAVVAGVGDPGPGQDVSARRPGSTIPATTTPDPFIDFDHIFAQRLADADEFYDAIAPTGIDEESKKVARQGYAGLLWSKQFYHYVVREWLEGDPAQPKPPAERYGGRNHDWPHLFNRDVISMPDKWEYPWFAAWDLAFHMVPFAKIDPHFAKKQLELFLREWYMHPNGQLAGLRVRLWRCESASARLGGLARL